MKDTVMSENEVNSVIPFHNPTNNFCLQLFFVKEKFQCWKVLQKSERFLAATQQLGATWELPSCPLQQVQTCVFAILKYKMY